MPLLRNEQKDDMLEITQFLPKSQDWIYLFKLLREYEQRRLKEHLKTISSTQGTCLHACVHAQLNTLHQ